MWFMVFHPSKWHPLLQSVPVIKKEMFSFTPTNYDCVSKINEMRRSILIFFLLKAKLTINVHFVACACLIRQIFFFNNTYVQC